MGVLKLELCLLILLVFVLHNLEKKKSLSAFGQQVRLVSSISLFLSCEKIWLNKKLTARIS